MRRTHWFIYALYALVIAKALIYWIYAYYKDPSSPLSVTAIHRQPEDLEYYILINALSQGNFGEAALAQGHGSGVTSFPFAAIAIHALCYRLFGVPGFIVADVIVYLLFFRVVAAFFELLGANKLISYASAALLSTGSLSEITGLLAGYEVIGQRFHFNVWGTRIPRPFVTEVFFFAWLWCCLTILSKKAAAGSTKLWVLTGISVSLLVQGDAYLALPVAVSTSLLATYLLLTSDDRRQILKGLALSMVASLICLIPFIVQRIGEQPDAPIRMGLFRLPRLMTFQIGLPSFTPLLIILATGPLVAFLQPTIARDHAARNTRIITFLIVLSIVSYFGLHINSLILGKAIQVDHFNYTFLDVSRYTILSISFFCLVIVSHLLYARLKSIARVAHLALHLDKAIVLTSIVAIVVCMARTHDWYPTTHSRKDLDPHKEFGSNYRPQFDALVRELSRDDYKARLVLGTLDSQLRAWWITFQQRFVFNPEPSSTTVSDAEIEYRLAVLCKLLGMQQGNQFSKFVNTLAIDGGWLGHNKYHVTRLHTFRPLEKYPADIREALPSLSWFKTWNLSIPSDEISRLENVFADSAFEPRLLDLDILVLTPYETAQGLEPTPQLFSPVYHNDVFKVWVRKLPSGSIQSVNPSAPDNP